MSIKLWEITAALKPTVFLLVLGVFLFALRAQRRRKKPLDPLGPFPAWTILPAYWYGPIYDTVIGPLAGLGVMTPPESAAPFYIIVALLLSAFFYAMAYLWRTGRRALAMMSVIGLFFYIPILDYEASTTLDWMVRHIVCNVVCFSLLFLAVLWASKNWCRRFALILSLIGIFAVGNYITGVAEIFRDVLPFLVTAIIVLAWFIGERCIGRSGEKKMNWKRGNPIPGVASSRRMGASSCGRSRLL